MRIDTAEDWWNAVEEHWFYLTNIIGDNMDVLHEAYETPGNDKSLPLGRTVLEEIKRLKDQRNGYKLARYFHAAWGLASDAYAWSVPSWGVLCDLCSEEEVLYCTNEFGDALDNLAALHAGGFS